MKKYIAFKFVLTDISVIQKPLKCSELSVTLLKPRPHNELQHFVKNLILKKSTSMKSALHQLCLLPRKLQCSSYIIPQIFSGGKKFVSNTNIEQENHSPNTLLVKSCNMLPLRLHYCLRPFHKIVLIARKVNNPLFIKG